MLKQIKYYKLAFYIGLCVGVGVLASFFTQSSVDTWFKTLNKPWFNPPAFLFAPVWTILYILMGVSAYIISQHLYSQRRSNALIWFYVQLALNFFWSFSFFYLRSPLLGLANILLLWVAIIVMIVQFSRISKAAGFLQIPYISWVTFASILNYSIWILN